MFFCASSAVSLGWCHLLPSAAMHTVHTAVCAAGFDHTTPSCYRILHTRPFWFKFIRIQQFAVLKVTKWHTPPLITVPHPKPLSPSCHCRQTNIPTYCALLPYISNDRTFHLLICYYFLRTYLLHTSEEQTNKHVSPVTVSTARHEHQNKNLKENCLWKDKEHDGWAWF
jgi:hypothetical protein